MSDPVRSLRKRLREKPDDVEAMVELAVRLDRDGQEAKADEWVERALGCDPAYPPALYFRGIRELSEGRVDAAAAFLDRLAAAGAPAERVLNLRSRVQLARGEFEASIATLEEWQRLSPDDPEPWRGLYITYDHAGRLELAITAAERAIKLDPDDLDLRLEYAEGLEALGRFDRARFEFERVLSDDPEDESAISGIARCLALSGREEEALETLESFTADRPHALDALLELAWLYRDTGHLADAAELVRRLVRKRPDDAELRMLAATLLLGVGDVDEAVANARRALAIEPTFATARAFIARDFLERGAHDECERQLLEGLRTNPEESSLLLAFASLRERQDRLVEAETLARRATEQDEQLPWAWECRSGIELRLGKIEEAIASARKALACDVDRLESHAAYGLALAVAGDRAGALAEADLIAEWDQELADAIRAAAEHG